jgi:beta-glucanase (GH16 family)
VKHLLAAALTAGIVAGCGSSDVPGSPLSASAPFPTATPTAIAPTTAPTPTVAPTRTPRPSASIPAWTLADPAKWPLAWSDEFDGAAGSQPGSATWMYDIGGGGWGNNERQFYTNDAANARLDGKGNLLLTVRASDGSLACHYGPCDYTSARVLTKGRFEIQYGRIEARIRVPGGFGLWPAFWMLGNDIDQVSWPKSGEIDIMEFVGRRPNVVLGTIHGPGYSGSSSFGAEIDLGKPVADDFHVFAVEWRPDHIAWFLDGVQYQEAGPADVAPNAWVFDHPFFLLLNVAVGGSLGGPVDPQMALPQSMAIDYVRLYQGTTP